MRLLLDENLSPRLATSLADLYPGSAHVTAHDLGQAPDEAVWAFAREHGYTLVTKDLLCEGSHNSSVVSWMHSTRGTHAGALPCRRYAGRARALR
jgi:hypothetical protein